MTDNDLIEEYRAARVACELAKDLLKQHDLQKLLDAISVADSVGAMMDPTLYRKKVGAMLEDREVFMAATKFIKTWEQSR